MSPRRRHIIYTGLGVTLMVFGFLLGSLAAHRKMERDLAAGDARITALHEEVARSMVEIRQAEVRVAAGTSGQQVPEVASTANSVPAGLVEEIEKQLQDEMGLMPVQLLRERRASFVELNAYDNFGKSSYGTAGYLGNGYFITVKHGVVALEEGESREPRRITAITIRYKDRDLPATLVDSGNADVEVHPGDWAIIRVKAAINLPPLNVDPSFGFEFADPIFRLGNDYSKGIILGTGYVGQRTANGLVTCLTDGHPGVSGGGVLDQDGKLVGIPIGRMQGDYRFSFILPVRTEMFRKVPGMGLVATTGDAD